MLYDMEKHNCCYCYLFVWKLLLNVIIGIYVQCRFENGEILPSFFYRSKSHTDINVETLFLKKTKLN